MSPEHIEDVYELSPMQEGMLFDTLYAQQERPYVVQARFMLRGTLNVAALKMAWDDLMRSRDVLRTSFHWRELDKPYQVVHREKAPVWQERDWRRFDPAQQQVAVQQYLGDDRALGFDVSQAPLVRLSLLQLGDALHELIFSSHHLILDGWSKALVVKELWERYGARCCGDTFDVPVARLFRDYILWLQRQDVASAERYWRERLRGFRVPTTLALEARQPDGAAEANVADEILRLSTHETEELRRFARSQHVTMNVLASSAWALLLARYSGQTDVLFGAVVATRPPDLDGIEDRVGLFINTTPVRVNVAPDLPVHQWLRRLHREQVEARPHEHVSLAMVQGWSQLPRGQALFDTLFVFENYPAIMDDATTRAGDIEVRQGHSVERVTIPLSLLVVSQDALSLQVVYDTTRFGAATIRRLLRHYRTVLHGLAAHATLPLSAVPLLTASEREQLTAEWNLTARPFRDDQCMHDLFVEQAQRTPEAIAILAGTERVTYRDLDDRANMLSQYLRDLGVGPDVRVAVCLERGPELVVAMLGIMKSGGAYVPLDPAYPSDRLAFLLEDAAPMVVLTSDALRPTLPASARVLCVDREEWRTAVASHPSSPLASSVQPDNLAYIIYTSGSTGTPKGVGVTHRGLTNVAWAQRRFGLTSADRMLQFASVSFDASVFEITMALTAGAALVLLPQEPTACSAELFRVLRDGEVTAATLPPSVVAALGDINPSSLRVLTVAGEACPDELVTRWAPGRSLWNLYGPTETTIWATAERCVAGGDGPSIGQPIDNTQTYVLDEQASLVPSGVAGELFVGGAGLARGYLGRPALTAERFLPNPFTATPGARLYRTGDRVRHRANGTIAFLGRVDRQFKLRGVRIEPGEVEAVLRRHEGVTDAMVMPREIGGERRAVAYVVPSGARQIDAASLRLWLAGSLPAHLVPTDIVPLAEWPLTANGKIDRAALPLPITVRPPAHPKGATAYTEHEQHLSALWRKLLGIQDVGLTENFFDLGGNSLLVLRMYAALEPKHGAAITMVDLFQFPTIKALAHHLGNGRHDGQALVQSRERGAGRRTRRVRRSGMAQHGPSAPRHE